MDMNSKLMKEGEDTDFIKKTMQMMMSRVKEWTTSNYPDRDSFNKERAAQQEQRMHDDDMVAQAMQKQEDEHIVGLEEEMKADNIQHICSHYLSESGGPWITGMTHEQLGELTAWIRMRKPTVVDKRYQVEDEGILCNQERDHSEAEKKAHKFLDDALTDGYHGNRLEKYNPGYKFRMDTNSLHGWVP
eukprot:13551495-Heterocapsa_arctica.AAC.1